MEIKFRKPDGTIVTVTDEDYKNVENLTDEEIERRAASDPDALPLTDEDFKNLKRIHRPKPTDIDDGKSS